MNPTFTEDYLVKQLVIFSSSPTLQKFHTLVEPLLKNYPQPETDYSLKKIRDTLLLLLVFGKLRVKEM